MQGGQPGASQQYPWYNSATAQGNTTPAQDLQKSMNTGYGSPTTDVGSDTPSTNTGNMGNTNPDYQYASPGGSGNPFYQNTMLQSGAPQQQAPWMNPSLAPYMQGNLQGGAMGNGGMFAGGTPNFNERVPGGTIPADGGALNKMYGGVQGGNPLTGAGNPGTGMMQPPWFSSMLQRAFPQTGAGTPYNPAAGQPIPFTPAPAAPQVRPPRPDFTGGQGRGLNKVQPGYFAGNMTSA